MVVCELKLAISASEAEKSPIMMRAARYDAFGGPIRVVTVPVPEAPADGVLVEVKATGVCRSDWHGWKGHDGDIAAHGLPFTPGHELSGVVAAVGEGVRSFRVGDRVTVPFILSCGSCRECARARPTICERQQQPGFTQHGSFAQYVALPRAERNLLKLHDNVSFVAAAALGCRTTTAYRAVVHRGRLAAGETLAVFGCGGVGLSAVMIGCSLGARVIAVDTSMGALARAKAFADLGGSVHTVDASAPADEVRNAVRALTPHAGGADLSIDAAGFKATCEHAVWCARRGGRVVQVGLPLGGCSPVVPMARVAGWELEIYGSHGMASDDFGPLLDALASGSLPVERLVGRCVSLAEGAKALEAMDDGSPHGITMITDFS